MLITTTAAAVIAKATAGGLVQNTDYAVKVVTPNSCFVIALSMKGVKFLVYDEQLAIPEIDVLILQANLLAVIANKGVAWPQV